VEIKYDRSGQPLPFDQQEAAQPKVEAAAPVITNPASAGGQVGTKKFEIHETADEHAGEVDPIQHDNPFVQEYLREQAAAKNPPATEQLSMSEPDPESEIEEEVEEAPTKKDHPNFKALREKAEKVERERDALLAKLLERQEREQVARPPVEKSIDSFIADDFDLPEDGYVEPKHVKKVRDEVKAVRREMAEYKKKTAQEMQEMMLYKQFPDLDTVLSNDNIALLKQMKPAYARQLDAVYKSGAIYEAGELAYNFMVDLGIHKTQASAPTRDYAAEKERAQKNSLKPRPAVSTAAKSESPLSKANAFAKGDLSQADMNRYYMEMEAAIRNRGD
jgi:hypothetical protein